MYTWEGDVDLYSVNFSDIVLSGSLPEGDITSVSWKLRMRVHTNAENKASTSLSVSNGSGYLYSPTVPAESYESDPSWPEFRRIATFSGTFDPPDGMSFSEWFASGANLFVDYIAYDTASIPGGISDLLYVEVTVESGGGWEAAYYDGQKWHSWDVQYYNGSGFENWEPAFFDGNSW